MGEERMKITYDNIMTRGPWRAAHFDWQFKVASYNGPTSRDAILLERQKFEKMVKTLNFTIYEDVRATRNLSKGEFLRELKKFKQLCASEPCGCILLSISSHGVILETDDFKGSGDLEKFEDYILTHPDQNKNSFSDNYIDERVSLKEIMEVFSDGRLNKIPKIFFIQSCRNQLPIQNASGGKRFKLNCTNKNEEGPPRIEVDIDVGFAVSVLRDNEEVHPIPQKDLIIPQDPQDTNIVYSPPYLENSIIVFSTPFGYAAGFESIRMGSHVWNVLQTTLEKMYSQPESRPVNLLNWLRETNRALAQSDEFLIISDSGNEIKYKPLLSICHTLTKQIEFK